MMTTTTTLDRIIFVDETTYRRVRQETLAGLANSIFDESGLAEEYRQAFIDGYFHGVLRGHLGYSYKMADHIRGHNA